MEQNREISYETLKHYLPDMGSNLPAIVNAKKSESDFSSEREILYKVLFDMKRDVNDLKKLTLELMKSGNAAKVKEEQSSLINKIYSEENEAEEELASIIEEETNGAQTDVEVFSIPEHASEQRKDKYEYAEEIEEEENLSLQQKELELIKKSLEKYNGKRKDAADELGISERTLYRKIKQYDL